METIAASIDAVRARIRAAEAQFGRPPGSVDLLAVGKTRSAEELRAAFAAGQRHFGENYLNEALAKMDALADLPIVWHFIGPLQSNKSRGVAEHFAWVHSVDRLKVATRLSAQRPPGLGPLQVCIEVNVSGEASKAGVVPEDLEALALEVAALPGLRLRGFGLGFRLGDNFLRLLSRVAHQAIRLLLSRLHALIADPVD